MALGRNIDRIERSIEWIEDHRDQEMCSPRAVHHGPWLQYRSNRMEYRIDQMENHKSLNIFKRPKNREDGSDFDDFWTESIVSTQSILNFQKCSNERKIIESIESIDWIGRSIDRIDRWPP